MLTASCIQLNTRFDFVMFCHKVLNYSEVQEFVGVLWFQVPIVQKSLVIPDLFLQPPTLSSFKKLDLICVNLMDIFSSQLQEKHQLFKEWILAVMAQLPASSALQQLEAAEVVMEATQLTQADVKEKDDDCSMKRGDKYLYFGFNMFDL